MYQHFLNVRKDNSLFESKGEGVFLRTTQHTIEANESVQLQIGTVLLQHKMAVSGPLHVTVALTPAKNPSMPFV
jgi:hypothetical protein